MTRARLYGLAAADGRHYSPHVWKVWLALRHKSIETELAGLGFGEIARITQGRFETVPVVEINGDLTADSFVILRMLDSYPGPALFPLPEHVGLAAMVADHCERALMPHLALMVVREMHDMMSAADRHYFRQKREARFGMGFDDICKLAKAERLAFPPRLDLLRRVLRQTGWLSGEAPAAADMILFGVLHWPQVCGVSLGLDAGDPVAQWYRRITSHYGIAQTAEAGCV